jgi:hypothetical protein
VSNFSHCAHCGRKLRNAFFCPQCGQPSCSRSCLANHMGRHSAEDRRYTSIIGERDRTREALANYNNNHRNPPAKRVRHHGHRF